MCATNDEQARNVNSGSSQSNLSQVQAVLNSTGFLPEGVHDMTLDQVEGLFGQFKTSDRRPRLFERLRDLWDQLRRSDFFDHLIVDGSFVTGKHEPGDIDLILALKPERARSDNWLPHEYNLVSARRIQKYFKFDLFSVPINSESYAQLLEDFSRVKGDMILRKGVIRLKP